MSNINVVVLSGHLGSDPEIRFTPKGNMVANFSLALNEGWKDEEGNRQERVSWVSAEAWGSLAEAAQKYLQKGHLVTLRGKLKEDVWEGENGTRRKLKVVVREIQLPPKDGKPAEEAEAEPSAIDENSPF